MFVVGLCSLALLIALAAGAAPAGAIVAKIGGHGYGVTPMNGAGEARLSSDYRAQRAAGGDAAARRFDEPPFGGTPLETEGGPVMHSVTTHAIYWDPPTSQFTGTTKAVVNGFFTDLAHDSGLASNVWGIAGQYTDSTGNASYSSTFAGPLVDGNPFPTSENCTTPNEVDKGPYATCLFDQQIQEQLSTFIAEKSLPKGSSQLYFVLLPHNVASCLPETFEGKQVCSNNFFCAYHSYIQPGTTNEIIYADIPFSLLDTSFAKGCQADGSSQIQLPNGDKGTSNTETRFADVALKYISHEYIEAVTDPLVNFDTAWVDAEGLEIADKCNSIPFEEAEEGEPGFDIDAFTPTLGGSAGAGTLFNQSIDGGSFYLQSEWDNAGKACLMKPLNLGAGSFAVPSAIAGSPVSFTGSATDPYGHLDLTWAFGDGTSAEGVSPTHTYSAAGEYTVTMTPADAFTRSTGAPVSHKITVAAPSGGGGGGGGGGGAGAPTPTTTTTTSTSTTTATTAVAPPSPNSNFTETAVVNAKTGAIAFTISVSNPGTLSWLATFPNGKFGAFASASRCRAGQLRIAGKCRPARISFAKGSAAAGAAGTVKVTLKPDASASKALRSALKRRKGLPVTVVLTFKSSLGGGAVAHSKTLTVKLKK